MSNRLTTLRPRLLAASTPMTFRAAVIHGIITDGNSFISANVYGPRLISYFIGFSSNASCDCDETKGDASVSRLCGNAINDDDEDDDADDADSNVSHADEESSSGISSGSLLSFDFSALSSC